MGKLAATAEAMRAAAASLKREEARTSAERETLEAKGETAGFEPKVPVVAAAQKRLVSEVQASCFMITLSQAVLFYS